VAALIEDEARVRFKFPPSFRLVLARIREESFSFSVNKQVNIRSGHYSTSTAMASGDVSQSIQNAIPAEFHMISGSHDSQTSADAYNVGKFQLPNPAGKAGGACTSALLQVLYRDGHQAADMSWVQCLRQMRSVLGSMGFEVSNEKILHKWVYLLPQVCLIINFSFLLPWHSKFHN